MKKSPKSGNIKPKGRSSIHIFLLCGGITDYENERVWFVKNGIDDRRSCCCFCGRLFWCGAAVVFAVVFFGVSVDTQAAGEDTVEFVPVQEGYYAVSGTASKDIDTSYNLGVAKIGAAYKEAGGLAYLDVKFMKKNGVYVMVLSANDVNTLKNMHTTTMNWLAQNAPAIVPSGTKRSDAILKAADWVADRMTYGYQKKLNTS